MRPFLLYKGATRAAVYFGVPLIPLVVMFLVVAALSMLLSLWWWGLLLPGWIFLAQVTRSDDRAFRILGLWLRTKVLNRWRLRRFQAQGEFWGASTYAIAPRRRAWDAEDHRWGG